MKIMTSVTALAVPALLLSQGFANAAATNSKAIDACAGAIAEYFEGQHGKEPDTQVDTSRVRLSDRLSGLTTFEMDAFDSSTQSVVGRFTCMVSGSAKVRKLVTLPLSAPDANERGRG